MSEMAPMFSLFGAGVVLTLLAGFYCLLITRNLLRVLLGLEVLTKGVTLLIVLCGHVAGRDALGQALAITMIVIEVSVIVAAVGIVLSVYRNTGSIDASNVQQMKG